MNRVMAVLLAGLGEEVLVSVSSEWSGAAGFSRGRKLAVPQGGTGAPRLTGDDLSLGVEDLCRLSCVKAEAS